MSYRYMPAGIFYPGHGGIGIYIKYHKPKHSHIRVKQSGPGFLWLDCPDRELWMTGTLHNKMHPNPVNFDEFVCVSLEQTISNADLGPDYYMVNYTQFLEGKAAQSPRPRRMVGRQPNQPYIVSDSGGFQLAMGREEFIDPNQLINWYNANCDLGMVLDVPVWSRNSDQLTRGAQIQKANTEILLANKSDNLELINIIHGYNDEVLAKYRDIVEDDRLDRLALSHAAAKGSLDAVDRIFNVILTGKKYKHYHILGCMNILYLIMFMRIAAKGFAPLITSDSSTHLQNAVSKGYLFQPFVSDQFKPWDIGDSTNFPSAHNELPCNCPVCSSIKYADVLRIPSGNLPAFLLMYHNIYATNRYLSSMQDAVTDYSTQELKALMSHQFKSRNNGLADETLRGLDYIDVVEQEGLAAARKKYSFYLGGLSINKYNKPQANNLFESRDEGEIKVEANHTDKVLGLYEKFHNL